MQKIYVSYKIDPMEHLPKMPYEFMAEDLLNLAEYYHGDSDHAHYIFNQEHIMELDLIEGIYSVALANNYIDGCIKLNLKHQKTPMPYTFITFECLDTGITYCTLVGYKNKKYILLKTIKINGTPHDIYHARMNLEKFLSCGKINKTGDILEVKFKKWKSKYE